MVQSYVCIVFTLFFIFFFFNDTATTEIYTLSLHDALPISGRALRSGPRQYLFAPATCGNRRSQQRRWCRSRSWRDRKSTRLNSSHLVISYAVFCLKKKNTPARVTPRFHSILYNKPQTSSHV